ncbi:MAG: ABC transporter substrate-binding protein [Armatimonadetes bacterium]|nr:ABC transporter substrate-binding protein [Anaerolineae bacterium]
MNYRFALLLSALLMIVAPGLAQPIAPVAENLIDGCVTDYDPSVDYFPAKVELTDAENFSVAYFNHYKVVTVQDAFEDAPIYDYVLVQCGTPAPDADDFPEGTQFVEVPTGNIIAMSTTQLPQLVALDLVDKLVGLDSFLYANTPEVRTLIDAGALVEVGSGAQINLELVLETEPGIVMTYGFDPDTDAHPKLIEAGIFTALNAEWREATPLGRAEWIKYTALFYNAEAQAESVYAEIATEYNAARELVADIPAVDRPVVLWNAYSTYGEAWLIPGAETYVGRLILDAGGVIALGEQALEGSVPLSLEVVYDGALAADIWVTNLYGVVNLDDLLAQDERYADFAAVQNGQVWNDDLAVNENGGSNFYELGVTNPQLILQDLVALFYPELLPNHEFIFYRLLLPTAQ